MTNTWYGFTIRESKTDASGRVGVVIGGSRFTNSAYDSIMRIHNAGAEGLSTNDVLLTDVSNAQRAGVHIYGNNTGTRFCLDEEPRVDRYVINVEASKPAVLAHGQYGAGGPKPWGQCGA